MVWFNWLVALSMLYDYKTKRNINKNANGIKSKFTKGGALLITTGFEYKF